jgi:DNA-binding MarR family transcriptional regulator
VSDEPWYADVVFPMLLAAARRRYGREIRDALASAGFTDMPRAGARLVGGIARNGPSLADAAADLAVSKQAASQLVDTLVLRGYLERRSDPADRRRIILDLTERGRAAADEIRAAVDRVDQRFAERVGADKVAETRRVLAALVEDGDAHFAD